MKPYLIFVLVSVFLFGACQPNAQTTEETNQAPTQQPAPSPDQLSGDYFLPMLGLDKRYKDMGMQEFTKAASRPIRPGTVINGEGQFPVYQIFDENDMVLANIYYIQNDAMQDIPHFVEIVSSTITTPEGIKVGDTYGKLTETYGDLALTGSEIEGWTHAYLGELQLRIDAYNPEIKGATAEPGDEILGIGFFL